jgi:DNA invertase Pin-like site-specific DNA recombinase
LHLEDLGVSAFKGDNATTGALAGFIAAVKEGRVRRGSVLLVESLDRLSRDQIGAALSLFLDLLGRGVEIQTFTPERRYTSASVNDLASLLEPLVITSRAHEESLIKSRRAADSWKRKRKAAAEGNLAVFTAACPAWLAPLPDGKGYRLRADRAATVRRAFRLAAEGNGLHEIAAALNRDKVPAFGRRGGDWHPKAVHRLLTNKAVFGLFQPVRGRGKDRAPAGDPVKGYFPPVVAEDEYYAVQGALTGRKLPRRARGKQVSNLFTGLLFNAADGEALNVNFGSDSHRGAKLVSAGARRGREGSTHATFPYAVFERGFLHFVRELTPAEVAGPSPDGPDALADEAAALAGRLVELDAGIAKWKARAQANPTADAPADMLMRLDAERKQAAARLETVKAGMAAGRPPLAEAKAMVDLLDAAEGKEERTALRSRVKSAVARLVAEIWLLSWDATPRTRVADVQAFFRSGAVRDLCLFYVRGSRHSPAAAEGVTRLRVAKGGSTAGKEDLRRYRTDDAHRAAWDRWHEAATPALEEHERAQLRLWELGRRAAPPEAYFRALALREAGRTYKQILADLNAEGIPAPAGGKWNRVGQLTRLLKTYTVNPEE